MRYFKLFVSVFLPCLCTTALAISPKIKADDDFPIGVYSVQLNDNVFAQLKAAGIDYVHSYGVDGNKNSIKTTEKLLKMAAHNKLKVMMFTRCNNLYKRPNGWTNAQKVVNKFKDNPTVGLWLLGDEPPTKLKNDAKKLNEIIKQEAPKIPTSMVVTWNNHWHAYTKNDTSDYLMMDAYPIRADPQNHGTMMNFIKFINRGIATGKPVIPVIQIFNYKVYPWHAKKNKYDIKKCRIPNEKELRLMIYSSVSRGVAGVFFFAMGRCYQTERKTGWIKNTFFNVTRELRNFAHLTQPTSMVTNSYFGINFIAGQWIRKTGSTLTVSNISSQPALINFQLKTNPGKRPLKPWGRTRKNLDIKINKLNITAKLEPMETVILSNMRTTSPEKQ